MLISENKFYIYRWIRLDTNTPFYIGKGSNGRAYEKIKSRNQYFINIIKSIPTKVEVFILDLSEKESFIKEIEFIKLYKNFGYCEANITHGGEGTSGLAPWNKGLINIYSEEVKLKISLAKKGSASPFKGKTHSSESKRKNAEAHSGKAQSHETRIKRSLVHGGKDFLVFTKDGTLVGEWSTKGMCADDLGISKNHIISCLSGKRKTHNGYIFKYKVG